MMMIMQPEWVTIDWNEKVRIETINKKSNPSISHNRFAPYEEGLGVQPVYTGSYKDEAPTIGEMHHFIKTYRYQTNGKALKYILEIFARHPQKGLRLIYASQSEKFND